MIAAFLLVLLTHFVPLPALWWMLPIAVGLVIASIIEFTTELVYGAAVVFEIVEERFRRWKEGRR